MGSLRLGDEMVSPVISGELHVWFALAASFIILHRSRAHPPVPTTPGFRARGPPTPQAPPAPPRSRRGPPRPGARGERQTTSQKTKPPPEITLVGPPKKKKPPKFLGFFYFSPDPTTVSFSFLSSGRILDSFLSNTMLFLTAFLANSRCFSDPTWLAYSILP